MKKLLMIGVLLGACSFFACESVAHDKPDKASYGIAVDGVSVAALAVVTLDFVAPAIDLSSVTAIESHDVLATSVKVYATAQLDERWRSRPVGGKAVQTNFNKSNPVALNFNRCIPLVMRC